MRTVATHARRFGPVVALAVFYAVCADAALQGAVMRGNAAPLWPPAGIALAAVVVFGPRMMAGVALGEFSIMVIVGTKPWAAALMGCGNALTALLGARLFGLGGGRPRLDRIHDVVVLLLAGALAALLGASVGAAALASSGAIPADAILTTWRVWWLGDLSGVLVVAPLVFVVPALVRIRMGMESVVLLGTLVVVAVGVLHAGSGQPYVLFPLLAWIGVRLGPQGAALANLLTASVAIHWAVDGQGPFAHASIDQSVLQAQTFLLVMAVASLALAAVAAELRASQHAHALLAQEQAALRRVAEAVARQDDPDDVRALADRELAILGDAHHREQIERLVVVAVDAARARAHLIEQARTDPLTGLANHGAFHRHVAEELKRARRHDRDLALVVLDLDGFKRVNDVHGHLAGDEVLKATAAVLRDGARASDMVGRLGGDEFAWVMPETDAHGALLAAERCREAIAAIRLGASEPVTASIGVCDLEHAHTTEGLVRHADEALYRVKAQGGNGCGAYDGPDDDDVAVHRDRTTSPGRVLDR